MKMSFSFALGSIDIQLVTRVVAINTYVEKPNMWV